MTENYDITRALGSYAATDAKDMRAVYPRWSLTGRDGSDFVIDPATGALTFRYLPDYDRPADSNRDNLYEVTVRGLRRSVLRRPERDRRGDTRQ